MDEMDAASPSSAQPTAEQEQQRRLRALSQIAQSQVVEEPPDADAPAFPLSPRPPAKRRWVAALALVVVLVGSGIGYALTRQAATLTTAPAPPVMSLNLAPSGASCPVAAAWSPDGSRLAVLARQGTARCDAPGDVAPVVLIYDVGHGRLVTRLDPATALALAGPFPAVPGAVERLIVTPDRCAGRGLPPCTSTPLPYPDRALAEVVGKLAAATGTARDVAVPIAWSADGRLLATILPQDGLDGRAGRLGITLFNTATGEITQRFTVDSSGSGDLLPQLSPVLAWSPKAPRLAFMDATFGRITIWSGITTSR